MSAAGPVMAATFSGRSPQYLQQRNGVPEELIRNIAVLGALAGKAVE